MIVIEIRPHRGAGKLLKRPASTLCVQDGDIDRPLRRILFYIRNAKGATGNLVKFFDSVVRPSESIADTQPRLQPAFRFGN